MLGHLVLYASFFIPFALAWWVGIFSDDFLYSLEELKRITLGLFFASSFLMISAAYSDVRNEPGDFEWLYIIVSALLLYFFDIRFVVMKIPFFGTVDLHFWGLPLLLLWVLLIVSIVELLDFFEGLAGSVVFLVCLAYYFLHLFSGKGEFYQPFFFATLAGAIAGILPFQLFTKKILYGKSGNKILGFLFAAGTVIARRKETTGQFFLFPIVIILFVIVLVNFLFLESQLRPIPGPGRDKSKKEK